MSHSLGAFLVAIALQAPLPNPQAQNPAAQQQPARATIEGRVVRAGTSEPLARAQVTVTRVVAPATVPGQPGAPPVPAAPGAQAGAARPNVPGPAAANAAPALPTVMTDAQGRFTIKDLPPGSYR